MGTDKLTKRVRGEGGKFKKQKTTMPKTLDVTRLLRNLLLQSVAGPDGKMRKGDKTRIRAMFDNIFEIASMSPEQPVFDKFGNPIVDENGKAVTAKDAKIAMASVQAFKELMSRAYGMPSKSDEEMDALKTQGVKIVVIAPPNMMDKEVYEEKPKEKLVPAFIDAEIVTKS
jgi:uncharacterized tellurite resistance protein B-like protein